MRLVCDHCNAAYTIEDRLVGTRDFRVSCKACKQPIFVKSARQVAMHAVTQRVRPPGAALPPPSLLASAAARASNTAQPNSGSFTPSGHETWFVSVDGKQVGPHSAHELAQMLEQSRMDWASEVWREGLKGWRPARRDALLVTAVAGARGVASDTTRLNAARSFIAAEDTKVDEPPKHASMPLLPAPAARQQQDSDSFSPRPVPREVKLPDLRPSARPQAWHSPENAAFRDALGLPTDSAQRPAEPAALSTSQHTLIEAFESVPRQMRRGPREAQPAPKPGLSPLIIVAALSFVAGVVTATGWERATRGDSAPVAHAAPVTLPVAAEPVLPVHTVQAVPSTITAPMRELPTVEELRAEVRKVAPDVKRCVEDPAAGVDVDIYLDGPSGRVRDVDVRSALITPGRADCIVRSVRRMQLPPFSRNELKLMHKFSW